jgi:hypothetical protein
MRIKDEPWVGNVLQSEVERLGYVIENVVSSDDTTSPPARTALHTMMDGVR